MISPDAPSRPAPPQKFPLPDSEYTEFVYTSAVHFDELDALQMLHNARYAVHVERAIVAFYRMVSGVPLGRPWQLNLTDNPDHLQVVREFQIDFLAPFRGTGELRIEIWVEQLGRTSCTYRFTCTSAAGIVHA